MTLPINPDILLKRKEIPEMLAKLSYIDKEKAIHYMRLWGEKRIPITPLYDELLFELDRLKSGL